MADNKIQKYVKDKKDEWATKPERLLKVEESRVIQQLRWYDPDTEEYRNMVMCVEKMHNLRKMQKKPIPIDTLISCGTTLVAVAIIATVELKGGLFTSKAVAFIPRVWK